MEEIGFEERFTNGHGTPIKRMPVQCVAADEDMRNEPCAEYSTDRCHAVALVQTGIH